IVDGNVARVFARYFLIEGAVDQPAILKRLWQLAGTLVESSGAARDFNQGVMELGALICTPKSTKCLYCPLRDRCGAYSKGRVADLPVKTPKKKPVVVTHTVLAIERGGKYLFAQRPADGMWSNMWELPTLEEDVGVTAAVEFVRDWFNLTVAPPQPVARFTHQTTHRTIQFRVHRAAIEAGRLRAGSGVWRKLDRLADLPLAKPQLTAVDRVRSLSG
ncbi:MAG: NUDIX domain-containing protein, partial [Planctomycetota bacterium]